MLAGETKEVIFFFKIFKFIHLRERETGQVRVLSGGKEKREREKQTSC